MRNTTTVVLASLVAVATPLAAQTQSNSRVMAAMSSGGKYTAPTCPIPGGNFRTSDAGLSLKIATEGGTTTTEGRTSVDTKKFMDLVTRANKTSYDAAVANPQAAAAWYFLGRSALMLGDVRGADTAFTRLEKLSPDCAVEIKGLRQKAWLVLVTPSTDFLNKKQYDSALVILREANIIAHYFPQGYYNLGATFASMTPTQADSAIYYFQLAADVAATDPQLAADLKRSVFNMGVMYRNKADYKNAAIQYRRYLTLEPGNDDVTQKLAESLRLSGDTAGAKQIDNQMYAAGKMSGGDVAARGVRLFNEKDYAGAAEAFKNILATDPYNHDALFNLANAYLALSDGKNLIATAQKLLEFDPLSTNNVKLLANGWKFENNLDKQVEIVTMLQAMTVNVSIDRFALRKDGAKISGVVTGIEGRTASDKVIAPTASTLVFEFIDAAGAVVATQEVAIQALAPNAKQEITADATGEKIIGWKYHKK